jgi:hypothetical protein
MKNFFSGLSVFFFLFLSIMLESCKPGVPREYIQPGDMEDILYDYSLAEGITRSHDNNDSLQLRILRMTILKKYDVTEAEVDSSMIYYLRHTEQMQKIYENLADRLNKEARAQGVSSIDISSSSGSETGDTANIWRGDRAFVLSQFKPFNVQSYSFSADSSYHKGDNVILEFATQFICQNGGQDGVVALVVTFGNDSIGNQTMHISSNSTYHLQIMDDGHKGIKSVRGYFLFNGGQGIQDSQAFTTGLKMLFVYNIRLVKMHETKGQRLRNDSIRKASSQPDSSLSHPIMPPNNGNGLPPSGGGLPASPDVRRMMR